ncbi:MAG: SRPBCC domain-containing protein, partial [Rhodospirillaceae bacterium]|nr:SRPBCC domain-containing protein [Rhodospirillaceae bacterium]
KVFAAFADPVKKRRWFAEGEGFIVDSYSLDFRVGGIEAASFRTAAANGPIAAGTVFKNHTTYHDIVPNQRIVSAYSMAMSTPAGDHRFSVSLATVEFKVAAKGTQVLFTEQGAYFEGADGTEMRKAGWISLVDALARELAAH